MTRFGSKCVRASRNAEREYFKVIFLFLLVPYEKPFWCAKFQGNRFSDAKINGPLLGRLPLNSEKKLKNCFRSS